MLVVLAGVTGVGKSFFKKVIVQELGFKNLPIVTTREKRVGEINSIDKEFVSEEEFETMKKKGIIKVNFEFMNAQYGYRTEHLKCKENQVTELHYSMIYEFRKQVKDLFAIYMIPYDIKRAKLELEKRNFSQEVFKKRLLEIDEHAKEYEHNKILQQQFDYVFINDYTEVSTQKVVEFIKNKIDKK